MVKSLRGRLQLWYGLVLTAAVVSFAIILYSHERSTIFGQIDSNLIAAAEYLDAAMRSLPTPLLEGPDSSMRPPRGDAAGPEKKGPPMKGPPDGKGKGKAPSRRPPPERLIEQLGLPPSMNITPNQPNRQYYGLWRADNTLIKGDGGRDGEMPQPPTEPSEAVVVVDRGDYREATRLGPMKSQIVVGVSVLQERSQLRTFAWQLAGSGISVVGFGLLGGWFASSRIVRPIAKMSASAAKISVTNLSQRIDVKNVDAELAGLANVLNAAFDRLQAAFDRQAQFTADASHELRTPLAVIRSHADWALSKPRELIEYCDTITACRDATERMAGLVDGLLTLARADAGFPGLRNESVDLCQIANAEVELFRPLAAEKRISLSKKLAHAIVCGDADALTRVVHNLLANAVQYCQADGAILIRILSDADGAVLEVSDTGIGIPDENRQHVFDRFYRVDKARSREIGGVGLGLAICREIVIAHGGRIECRPNENNRGTIFAVWLPPCKQIVP